MQQMLVRVPPALFRGAAGQQPGATAKGRPRIIDNPSNNIWDPPKKKKKKI